MINEDTNTPNRVQLHNVDTATGDEETKRYGQVYTRRPQSRRDAIAPHDQTFELRMDLHLQTHSSPGNNSEPSPDKLESTELLDLHIAFRKGVRACTKHPLSNHVSYNKISTSYSNFISQLHCVNVPKTVQEALRSP